jgi:hypothetical protein
MWNYIWWRLAGEFSEEFPGWIVVGKQECRQDAGMAGWKPAPRQMLVHWLFTRVRLFAGELRLVTWSRKLDLSGG